MSESELSYTSARESGLRPRLMRAVERMSGMERIRPLYEIWRKDVAGKNPRMMNEGLAMLGTRLVISSPRWPAEVAPQRPLVMIANHPFGIGDGIAALALAEDLGRPYRVLLNKEFMRVPEIHPVALPIDFSDTREAFETNLRTRNEARKLLQQGVTMVIFPGGGVATARLPWERAEELPWKAFAARLIQMSRASVLPVFFEGQNSALFHALSRITPGLRMSMMVAEFRRFAGREIRVHIGSVVDFENLAAGENRAALLDELYALVHQLAPHNAGIATEALKSAVHKPRQSWSWDAPVARKRKDID